MDALYRYDGVQAIRWIIIVRENKGKWQYAALSNKANFYIPPKSPSVEASEIPITLRALMNIEEFHP